MKRPLSFLSLAALLLCTQSAPAAPAQLTNKSVVISFAETRSLREIGTDRVQGASLAITINLYISRNGRIFDNYASQTSSGSASGGQGGGTASTGVGAVHAKRDWRFSGNALIGQHMFDRGARRMTVAFNPGFTGCTLSVVNAKQQGSNSIVIISSTTGKRLEVVSSSIGSTSCSIKDGNVFGGQ